MDKFIHEPFLTFLSGFELPFMTFDDKSFKSNKCTTPNCKTILPKNIDKYNTIIYNKNIKNQTENSCGNKVIFL